MKTKRAKALISCTSYTEESAPALCALVDFAAQAAHTEKVQVAA